MTNLSKRMSVTAVANDNGVITAFFDDLPGLLVQGGSIEDVRDKLKSLLESYIKRLDSWKDNIEIETQSLV
ncbi:hypothetical protein [Ferruginibacter albus]|uniref:hypothetical protein n=1 Tax=Ferruginibacter albus TaxID=2875540 RepID=UPI001CC49766|nr:hypothetical protein [Ferruginibacter albus]UAY53438.1 hypothetical protein K9M53_07130 [Ferruginibacter albus]